MNKQNTRNLIASTLLALAAGLGLFALLKGSGEVAVGFGVVASLAILGAIELRGASRGFQRQPKDAVELYRSAKSEA